jgi:hydrogenase maturation protease
MSEATILVAGIGNIFLGDDGFGVEVVRRLASRQHAENVRIADYGIRGFDLAFALLDDPAATILIDAMPRGGRPGTVYVLDPDLDDGASATQPDHAEGSFQGHAMTPDSVFALVRTLGGVPRNVTIVGCEPLTFGPENEGSMELSEPVANAVAEAVTVVEGLLAQLVPTTSTSAS